MKHSGSAAGTLNSNSIKILIKAYECILSNLTLILYNVSRQYITLKSIQQDPVCNQIKYLQKLENFENTVNIKMCVLIRLCLSAICLSAKCLAGEMSKLSAKCPSAKCLSAKCLSVRCLVGEMSIGVDEMSAGKMF